MRKKTMTLEQHCLLREVKQLITDSKANGKHAKAKTIRSGQEVSIPGCLPWPHSGQVCRKSTPTA